jgi:hypothetical protein
VAKQSLKTRRGRDKIDWKQKLWKQKVVFTYNQRGNCKCHKLWNLQIVITKCVHSWKLKVLSKSIDEIWNKSPKSKIISCKPKVQNEDTKTK